MKKIKNKNKPIILILAVLLIVSISTGSILAGKTGDAINNIDTGVVNIEISEFMLDGDGNEVPWEDKTGVLPGMSISKIPYFTATGNDCYVRATINVKEEIDSGDPVSVDDLGGISEDWVRIGDYFYYKNILKTNEKVAFFRSIEIPNWEDDVNPANIGDWSFFVDVTVDAVQSDNFNPDFESNSPWGDVVIQESINKDGYDVNTFTTNSETNMFVTIVDEDNIVIEPEDFFSGFKTMMPGDVLTDSVEIDVEKKSEVFFSTESLADIELLDKLGLKLTLYKGGKTTILYDSELNANIKRMSLGKFEKGETATLSFTISMPEDLDNEFTLRNASAKWTFEMTPDNEHIIKTGDDTNLLALGTISLLSIAAIALALTRRKRDS